MKLLLTIQEAAESLGVGRTKLYQLIASGELDTVSIGRARRITVESVEAFVLRLQEESGLVAGASHLRGQS